MRPDSPFDFDVCSQYEGDIQDIIQRSLREYTTIDPDLRRAYECDDEEIIAQRVMDISIEERMSPVDPEMKEAIQRSQDEEIVQQTIDRSLRERMTPPSEMDLAIERSRRDDGSERAINLAIELSENEHATEEVIKISELEQQEFEDGERMADEAKLTSLQTYCSEVEWAAVEAAAEEEIRRAVEEEQEHMNRSWKESPFCEAQSPTTPRMDSYFSSIIPDEGYGSCSSQSESLRKRSGTPTAYLPAQPPRSSRTGTMPEWEKESVPEYPTIPFSRSTPPNQNFRHSAESRRAFKLDEVSTAHNELEIKTGLKYSSKGFNSMNSKERHPAQLEALRLSSRNSLQDYRSKGSVNFKTVDRNRKVSDTHMYAEKGWNAVPSPSWLPPQIEHHYHGDVYLQEIYNHPGGINGGTTTDSYQGNRVQHSNVSIEGLRQSLEQNQALQKWPTAEHFKSDISRIKTLGRNNSKREDQLTTTPNDWEQHGNNKPPFQDERHEHGQTTNSEFSDHPQNANPVITGAWNPPFKMQMSRNSNDLNAKGVYQSLNAGGITYKEPFYGSVSSVSRSNPSFHATFETQPLSDPNLTHLSNTSTFAPMRYQRSQNRSPLVEPLERKAACIPAMPGAYPASFAPRAASNVGGISTPAVYAAPLTAPGPPIPPKIPISNGADVRDLPELTSTERWHRPEQYCRFEPDSFYNRTASFGISLPHPAAPGPMSTPSSLMVHSPTPSRLRTEVGRSFAYRPLNMDLPLVPGPDQDFRNVNNHAMRDLDRYAWSAHIPPTAPALPNLACDNPQAA